MSKRHIYIAPSILAADPLNLATETASVEAAGADWHHVDVMDGHFVPNLTFGLPLIRALKKHAKLPLDVHIMVQNPDLVAMDYVDAGADLLAFPIESAIHPHRLLQSIRAKNIKAGLAINPGTAMEKVFPLVYEVDLINVMSVNPGFGGQKYIPQTVERIAQLYEYLDKRNLSDKVIIEVDGGINHETAKEVVRAGASALVAGTYVYQEKDRKKPIQALRSV